MSSCDCDSLGETTECKVLIREILIKTKKLRVNLSKKFRFFRNFLIFKTTFEEIKTKPDLENKIYQRRLRFLVQLYLA